MTQHAKAQIPLILYVRDSLFAGSHLYGYREVGMSLSTMSDLILYVDVREKLIHTAFVFAGGFSLTD